MPARLSNNQISMDHSLNIFPGKLFHIQFILSHRFAESAGNRSSTASIRIQRIKYLNYPDDFFLVGTDRWAVSVVRPYRDGMIPQSFAGTMVFFGLAYVTFS